MEDNKKKWKERINYIKDVCYEDGRTSYTGQSVNYGCCCSSWESVEDLQIKMKAMIDMWLEVGQEMMAEPEPLEMKECTRKEWDAREDNIDYWEMERIKRILQRPTVRAIWEKMITDTLGYCDLYDEELQKEKANEVIDMLINQDIGQYSNK